jgi:hypothetical protein
MADDPTYRWNWKTLTQGNTRPATFFTETSGTSSLTEVELRMKLPASTDSDIRLYNGSGIVINTATAGAWSFTISAMSAATTDAYTPGVYSYELDVTEASGVVTTILKGEWNLIARIPD